MKIETIKYRITLTIDNLITNNLDKLNKNITRKNIELEYDNPIEIDKKHILNYFSREIKTYCTKKKVDMDNLVIDGYEIVATKETRDLGVDVYFKSEDINTMTFEPSIMAKLTVLKDMPVLQYEQLNDTTIKWFWTDNKSVNYIKDKQKNIISEVPYGVNYYIESDLTPGATYTRILTTTNKFNEQIESMPAMVTLKINSKPSIYNKFKIEDRNEDIKDIDINYSSKLKAFQSGVGDFDDCKLYKADDTKFSRRFKLLNKIYGVRASNDIKHNAIKFKYRFKLKAKVDYLSYSAKYTVRVTATQCVNIQDDPDPTLLGSPMVCERDLIFTIDDNTQVNDIYLYQFFPNLLPKDYKKRYKFDVEIFDTSGRARVYMYNGGYHNILNGTTIKFSEHGYFDHMFTVAGIASKKTKEYTEIYPTSAYDPYAGVINGDFEMSTDGLKDLRATMNKFQTSDAVYDKKYYIQFESISPDSAYVKYEFDNQVPGEDYTLTNGDGIRFYSNSIFADDTEHREFIMQTEEGPFIIEDNKKHKYFYYLNDIKLDLSAYKRFEMEVVPTINDIVMVNYPKNLIIAADGTVDMPMQVSCRNLQSATAKWSPSIHNGYYYYNQKEHFLYSKCSYGLNGISQEYIKKNVKIKLTIGERGDEAEDKYYDITYKSKEDLLLDDYHYCWEDNKIWPNPIEVYNDYYMEFATTYEYYSKPIVFDEIPTSINSITWDEAGTPNSGLDVYAITYDEIYGKWNAPVKIEKNKPIPNTLIISKILLLKFVLKPSRRPNLEEKVFQFNCEADWKNNRLKFLTYNTYFMEEILMPTSELCTGAFVSKFIDLGDTADSVKGRSIKFDPRYEGEIEFYVQHADSKLTLQEKMTWDDWEKVDINSTKTDLKRFVRYMILLRPQSKLHNLLLTVNRYSYQGMAKHEFLPGFGNINVKAEIKNEELWEFRHTEDCTYKNEVHLSTTYPRCSVCHHVAGTSCADAVKVKESLTIIKHDHFISTELIFNKKEMVVIDDLRQYMINLADALNVPYDNIVEFSYIPYGDELNFKISNIDNKLVIESLEEKVDENNFDYTDGATFELDEKQIATMSPIPQQYAPVIIYADDEPQPYTQVFFTDENNLPTLTGTEEFISNGFATLYLKYIDIDPASIKITIDGIINTDFELINNIIRFNNNIESGKIIRVEYKILRSFMVEYDYANDAMSIHVYKNGNLDYYTSSDTMICGTFLCGFEHAENSPVSKIKVFYETNKLSACKQLNHISFNPIYNVRYSGYVYICDYQDKPQTIEIFPEDNFIYANYKDTMNVLVRVLDKNQNPIENVDINIAAAKGSLRVENNTTDINGIVKCVYTACGENCIDTIKAIVTKDVKAEAKITNRKL